MELTLKEVKLILDEIEDKNEKWIVLNYLIEMGIVECREYKLDEIAYLFGITKQAVKAIEAQALMKLAKFKDIL